ncbi:MAG: SMP-30/gluconolactonase/LRE family protein [Pseudomonadota bacterium]
MSARLDLVVDARNYLGEGVIWCPRTRCVLWTDIESAILHSYQPESGQRAQWTMPERLACFALTADPEVLLLGLASRLAFFHLSSGAVTPICQVEADLPGTRLNDGRCDRQGRLVFGTLNEHPGRKPIGSFYRLNHDLSLEMLPLPKVAIPNSICFSPDGASMYFCDSMHKKIFRWDGYARGDPQPVRTFVDVGAGPAAPDGATVDAEGCLWSAQWGGARVVRYRPDGSTERIVHVPVSQPSCPCLGGTDLNQLFVTSAQEGLSASMLADEPQAGGLFHSALLTGVRGLPETRFGVPA